MIHQKKTLYAFERDMFEICEGVSVVLEEPRPDPANPIIRPGQPGSPDEAMTQFLSSVLPFEGGWGMWYSGRSFQGRITPCFAQSPDGRNWEKRGPVVCPKARSEVVSVFYEDGLFRLPLKDPFGLRPEHACDPKTKQIIVREMTHSNVDGVPSVFGFAESTDGIHFTSPAPRPPLIPIKFEAPRVYRFKGRYVMSGQTNGNWVDAPACRVVVFATSDDLKDWTMSDAVMLNESWNRQTHCGVAPIKCIDDRVLIGLGGRFDDAPDIPDQHFDITLLYSYDGVNWRFIEPTLERRSWIRRGRPGDWDFGGVEQGEGLAEDGDDAMVYYGGSSVGNLPTPRHPWVPGAGAVGRALFRRDRFAFARPCVGWRFMGRCEPFRGVIRTKPLSLSEDRGVTLNVLLPNAEHARLNVELLSEAHESLGSATIREGGVRAPVPIETRGLSGPVKLHITLIGGPMPDMAPQLYAIEY